DIVRWKVKSGHGDPMSQDACTDGGKPMDKSKVTLVFKDADTIMEGMTLTSDAGGNIFGTIKTSPTTTPNRIAHKYSVQYGSVPAGPDPEIDVDCPGCGPGGGGPTHP